MNTWFQFKQFMIRQDRCAMKVSTDACLFGAVVADRIFEKEIDPIHILDIGCGTGLLSLMLAQVTDASIDAVEIEHDAFQQAKENFEENNKQIQITAHHSSITSFNTDKKFDLIICNPPFYENNLKSPSEQRNLAMHTDSLNYGSLSSCIKKLLHERGKAAILLPFRAHETLQGKLLSDGLFVNEKLHVRHSTKSAFIRTILFCSFIQSGVIESYIEIKNDTDGYSKKFNALLAKYYLNL